MVWTGNPKQGADFANENSIDLDEIAMRKQVIDRTDLLIVMRPVKDRVKREAFNRKVLDMQQDFKDPVKRRIIRNYDEYVKRHILYARTLNPKMTVEARDMIAQAEARIQEVKFKDGIANAGSNRALGTLERLATVIAKLKLHRDEITTEDAADAIDFYNKISAQVHSSVDKPQDIAEYSTQTMVFILQNESNGLSKTFKELCELASAKDPSIKWYLYQGHKNRLGDVSTNKASRQVLDRLESFNPKKIRRVKQQPAEFLWVGGKDDEEEPQAPAPAQQESSALDSKVGDGIKESSKEGLYADPSDPADQPSSGLQENKQTKLSVESDKNVNDKTIHPEEPQSARSARSASAAIVQDEREYKILKAMEQARAKYNSKKVTLKESGSLIAPQDVWGNLIVALPDGVLDMSRVIEIIEEQKAKGRVLTRQGDPPGRYYFIWHDSNGSSKGEGE